MKRRIALLAGAALAAAALTACGGSSEKQTAAAEKETTTASTTASATTEAAKEETTVASEKETFEKAKIRLAYMPTLASSGLTATAREKGYFEEMGLEVEMVEFQGGPAEIAAMASGDIDISNIGHGAHALCAEGEAVIFQIDCTSLADEVIGNRDKGVNSIEDLKGKTVAVTSGTSAEIILNLALASAGLTQDDLELVEMDANGCVSAMVSGNVDACATWSPGTITIKDGLGDKAIMLANNADYDDQVTFPSSYITTQKYADENRDVLIRFTRALQKASDYRKDNMEDVAKIAATQCEVDAATMLASMNEGNWLNSEFVGKAIEDGTIKNYYENQQKVFLDSGRLTEAVDVDNYVLFDVMKEAYEANHK